VAIVNPEQITDARDRPQQRDALVGAGQRRELDLERRDALVRGAATRKVAGEAA
jgi:hypothetical protein